MDIFRHLIDITVCLRRLGSIPLPADGREAGRTLAEAGWALPILGAFLGGLAAMVYLAAAALGLGPGLAAALAVSASIGLTGAGPERALAGAAARLARRGEEGRPPFGEWETISLILALGLRIGAIAAIEEPLAVAGALVGAGALGHAAVAAAVRAAPDAGAGALAGELGAAGIGTVATAALIGLAISLAVVPHGWFAAAVLAGLATAGLARAASGREPGGGAPGPAAMPVAEVLALLAIAAAR